jgi:periplasmic protein CpxP/Spy
MRSAIMRLRSIALVLTFCVLSVFTSYAQSIPKARVQRLRAVAKQLDLTRQQEKELIPILKAEEPQLQAIRNDQSLFREEKLQRLSAVHDQSTPQIKAILTPVQFQQLQIFRQQRLAQLMEAAKSSQSGAARSSTPPQK